MFFPFHADIVSDWSPMHEAAIQGRLLSLRSLINQVRGFGGSKKRDKYEAYPTVHHTEKKVI